MEINDSNPKPQPTGGLKLMTVFIGVLALHVVVIGGITIYHLMGGGGSDVDLVTDKTHKDVKVATDGSLTDPTATASTAPTPAPAATDDTKPTATPPTTATPAPDVTASTDMATTVAPTTTPAATPAPATTPETATTMTAPAPATDVTSATPSGPTQTGPVITPPPTAPVPATTPAPATDMAADTEATAPAPDQNAPVGIPYTVKKHDSLARIAHTHHITVASLKAANNLQSSLLHIGQKLVIPGKTTAITDSTEAVGPGETADTIAPITPVTPITSTPAEHHASTGPDRTLLGDSVSITTPEKKVSSTTHDQSPLATTGSHHTYTVMKGDTLSRIAHKFHTTTHALLAANSIGDSHKLRLGQKLRIPSSEPRSATNTAPTRVSQPEPIEPRATPVEPQPAEPTGQLANYLP